MQNFKSAVEQSSSGILILQNKEVKYLNESMCNMLGYTREEFEKLNFVDDIVFDSNMCIFEQFDHSDKNHSFEYTYRIINKSNEIKYFKCIKSETMWDNKPAIELINIDASEKMIKHLENKLIVSSLVENVNIGLWRLDPDLRIIYANKFFCNIFERDFEDLQGTYFADLFYIEKETLFECLLKEEKCEVEILLEDGIKKWVKITCNTVGHNLENTGFVGTVVNITKDKIYLPELLKLREEIKQERKERIR